jgi:translation initiation factor 3 subunit M
LYEYTLVYVRSLSPSDPSLQEAGLETIATALRSPPVFNFDSLLKLDVVIASKDHPLFSLLQIVLNNGLSEFKSWEATHPGVLEKYRERFVISPDFRC